MLSNTPNMLLMWLHYYNGYYCSLSFDYSSSMSYSYQYIYFPFLEERLKNIDSLGFLGFGVKRRFIMVSPSEFKKLQIYLLLDNIKNN